MALPRGSSFGDTLNLELYVGYLKKTPIFIGCSDIDFHIPVDRIHESVAIFTSLNAQVTKTIYPNMGHTINQDEIEQINAIINDNIEPNTIS